LGKSGFALEGEHRRFNPDLDLVTLLYTVQAKTHVTTIVAASLGSSNVQRLKA